MPRKQKKAARDFPLPDLGKVWKRFFTKPVYLTLIGICVLGLFLRTFNIAEGNVLFDYDQYEDLFHTRKILLGDPPIIGRPIYGNPALHHGVFYFYYNLIPFVLFKANPYFIIFWNNLFNVGASVIVFLLSRLMFKKAYPALISAFLVAMSYEYIQFSGWISSTAPTLFSVPLYFLGLWGFYKNRRWGLPLAALGLGLSIQFEIFFVYLIPIFILFCLLFKPQTPKINAIILSVLILAASFSTFILTEFKLNFAGIRTFLNFSQTFDDAGIGYLERITLYLNKLMLTFANNLFPTNLKYGPYIGITVLAASTLFLRQKGIAFLLLFLFSPVLMLAFGFHKQPWFLIGMPGAVSLLSGFLISRLRPKIVSVVLVGLIGFSNIRALGENHGLGPPLFKAESSSLLSSQLLVVDYTYTESKGEPFSINSVTYPLYHNALWEYHYYWYGRDKYKYMPGWLGGDQLPMYKFLSQSSGKEKYIYMIIDNTYRIPAGFKNKGVEWVTEVGEAREKRIIGGFTVIKVEPYSQQKNEI